MLMGGNSTQGCANPNVPNSAFKPGTMAPPCPSGLMPPMGSCAKEAGGLPGMHMVGNGGMLQPPPPPPPPPPQYMCPPYPGAMEERVLPPICSLKEPCPPPPPHPAFPVSVPPVWAPHSNYNLSHLQQVLNHEKALLASQYLADPFNKVNSFLDLSRMGAHYPLGKKLFGCPQCRYITDRKNNLKRHVATMHQDCDKTLECCGVVFKNKASLRDHVLIFHSNGYMCRFCGRNFCRKALLKRHLTVHSGQKDYVCSLCDYATSHKSNLERHKKVHERQGTDSEEGETENPTSTTHPEVGPSNTAMADKLMDKIPSELGEIPLLNTMPGNPHPSVAGQPRMPAPTSIQLPPRHLMSFSSDNDDDDDDLLDDSDLQLSPINVVDDSSALINVVDLPN